MNTRPLYPLALLLAIGCAYASPAGPSKAKPRPNPRSAELVETRLSPARWVITESIGATFDEAETRFSPIPGPEPAIILGKRSVLEGGVLGESIPGPKDDEDLSGFRSLPKHLGGGFLFWSSSKTYYTTIFGGLLRPIAQVASSGGARPFLKGVLLRTNRGFRSLRIDPATGQGEELDFKLPPGTADAMAADERRAATLDMLGRIRITKDGGESWVDLSETRGFIGQSLNLGDNGELAIARTNNETALRLLLNGTLETDTPTNADARGRFSGYTTYTPQILEPTSRRALAPELFSQAIVAGALLPGGRVLVARERGLSLLTTVSARIIADTDLSTLSEPFRRCQATLAGSDILLLCTHNRGSHVLRLDGDIARPKLEATFPTTGGFVGDFKGNLAYTGRCGQTPPSALDFRRRPPAPPVPTDPNDPNAAMMGGVPPSAFDRPPEEPSPEELSPEDIPPDDARACIRLNDGTWVERRVQGDDARRLYRWIPGNNGKITALVLDIPLPTTKDASSSSTQAIAESEGVRIVRLDPKHPDLQGGRFLELLQPQREPPYASLDRNLWLEDDGTIRAWIALPDPDQGPENTETPPSEEREKGESDLNVPKKDEKAKLPLSDRLGGRSAGLSIAPDGKLTLHPLPEGTEQVVKGGPYALALAVKEDNDLYFESKDGGKSFQPILKPPIGRLDAPYDSSTPFGCSPLGCTISPGLIRLGWGSPSPKQDPPSPPQDADANPPDHDEPAPANEREEGIRLQCRMESEAEPWKSSPRGEGRGAGSKAAPALTLLSTGTSTLGALNSNTWTADFLPPFQPSGSFKKISIKDPNLNAVSGMVAPFLRDNKAQEPIELLTIASKNWLRPALPSAKFSLFDYTGRIAAAADWSNGDMLALDFERGYLLLIPKNANHGPAQVILRLQRVSDPGFSRFTLARRLKNSELALVTYSASTGHLYSSALDLGRAQSGPLQPLSPLRTLLPADSAPCRSLSTEEGAYRFVAEMPIHLRFLGKDGKERESTLSFGSLLISASPQHACLEGVETRLPKAEPLFISASFTPRATLSTLRNAAGLSEKAQCRLEP